MSEIEEIMARAIAPTAWDPVFVPDPGSNRAEFEALQRALSLDRARLAISALEAKGYVVVKRSVGVFHQQEVFLSEKKD